MLAALGCGTPADDQTTPAALCDSASPPPPDRLRRLTMTQYRNTVRDLVGWALGGDASEAARALAEVALDALPSDRREPVPQDIHGSYRRLDQTLEQSHVDAAFRVASTLADALTQPDRLARVAGPCATDADPENDAGCLDEFIARFGERVLRRPLDAHDAAFYRDVHRAAATATPAAGYAAVIQVILNAPDFLYFVEGDETGESPAAATTELGAYALASRLSYHFWQTMPDAELWQHARDGSLLEASVLEHEVERLVADPRTRATMAEFFADWLKLDDLPALDSAASDPRYAAFAGDDLPAPELRQHMIDDVLGMLDYYTWREPGGIAALLSSELSFARDEDLAAIYGVAPWDGVSRPPALPPGQRPGLFSRALFLSSGTANTRPIQKGVFLRRTILCDEIPPPPPGVAAVPPELRPDMTTRAVVEDLTEQPGSSCAGCHATLINPLGFATEGFDALGRVRSEQRLFGADGESLGSLPIDSMSVPRIVAQDETLSHGVGDLMRLLAQSGKVETCLARHYVRFTLGRWDGPADDCLVRRLRDRLVETGRIDRMLAEVALTPEFRTRTFDVASSEAP